MATFDFIEASSKGYKFLWDERRAIMRLAFPAAIIKFIGYILITTFDMEQNFLRHGLVLLPSFFVEGWLIAYLIRRALYNEALPFQLRAKKQTAETKESGPANPERYRLMRAGIAVYVLIWLTLSFVNGMTMNGMTSEVENIPEPSFETYLVAMALFALCMWLFRLVWLYVPVVMGYSITGFMRKAKGYTTSLYMVGAWLVCYLPFILLLMMLSDMALVVFPSESDDISKAYEFTMAAAKIIVNLASTVVASIAIAYGVQSMMNEGGHKK